MQENSILINLMGTIGQLFNFSFHQYEPKKILITIHSSIRKEEYFSNRKQTTARDPTKVAHEQSSSKNRSATDTLHLTDRSTKALVSHHLPREGREFDSRANSTTPSLLKKKCILRIYL